MCRGSAGPASCRLGLPGQPCRQACGCPCLRVQVSCGVRAPCLSCLVSWPCPARVFFCACLSVGCGHHVSGFRVGGGRMPRVQCCPVRARVFLRVRAVVQAGPARGPVRVASFRCPPGGRRTSCESARPHCWGSPSRSAKRAPHAGSGVCPFPGPYFIPAW